MQDQVIWSCQPAFAECLVQVGRQAAPNWLAFHSCLSSQRVCEEQGPLLWSDLLVSAFLEAGTWCALFSFTLSLAQQCWHVLNGGPSVTLGKAL